MDPEEHQHDIDEHRDGKAEGRDDDDLTESRRHLDVEELVASQGHASGGKGAQDGLHDDSRVHGLENGRHGTQDKAFAQTVEDDAPDGDLAASTHDHGRDECGD